MTDQTSALNSAAEAREHLSPEVMLKLLEITRRMAGQRDLDNLLEVILQESTRLMRAERASLFLYDAAGDELYSKIAQKSEIGEIRFPASAGIAGHIAQHRVCLNIPDAYADSRFNPDPDRRTGFRTRSILGCPMLDISGNLVGVLEVLNKAGGPFSSDDEFVLSVLGAQAGVALERARLLEEYLAKVRMEQDLAVARQIQQSLLPKEIPSLGKFDVAGWSQPADATGGDIYDFFAIEGGSLGLMLGDATGHGVGPALMICSARAAMRTIASQTADLSAMMQETNRLLAEDSTDGRFVTLFAAVADDKSGHLRYTSAGQGPTMLLRSETGSVEMLDPTGLPLGILPQSRWPSKEIEMLPGDVLIIVSDGIIECANTADEQLGVEMLMDVVREHSRQSAADILRAIISLTERFAAGEPFRDDRTAIIVRRARQ